MAEHSTKDCVHTYRMRDIKNGDLLGPDVSITFVELGKYRKVPTPVETFLFWQ